MGFELPPGTAAYDDSRSGRLRDRPPNNRQLLILLGLAIGLVWGVLGLLGLVLNGVVWLIPPSVEQQLGALVIPVYEKIAESSPAQDTLNQLLDRLEQSLPAAQRTGHNYQVLYVPDSTVNALALPGDCLVIYAGLVAQVKSENELMMVLGHELGHFAHRDHLRSLGQQLLFQLAIATFLGGDPGMLQSIAASGVKAVNQAQFSQEQERAADAFGLSLLQQTYGHVAGATDFFARLRDTSLTAFLETHPAPSNRVAQLERLIKEQRYPLGARSPVPEALISSNQ